MLQHRIRNQHNFSTGPSGGDLKSPQMQTGQRFRLACSTLSGESGIRNNAEKTGNPALSEQSGAECGAASARSNAVDTELARIIDAWPELPAEVKTAIVRLVENSGYAPVTD